MNLETPLVKLFDYEIAPLLEALPPPMAEVWSVHSNRQEKFKVHRQTRSIVFEWLENSWRPGMPVEVLQYQYAPATLTQEVYSCASRILQHFGGRVVKLMLASLTPGEKIHPHRDLAPALTDAHRCHVPLISSKDVSFYIDEKPHYLAPGSVYELDNTRTHAVTNMAPFHRVHLICDVMCPPLDKGRREKP